MNQPALHADPHATAPRSERSSRRQLIGRGVAVVLLVAVGWLIVDRARKIQWEEVWRVLQSYPLSTLAIALACATGAHLVYASYDLLARRAHGHHRIPKLKVFGVGLVSYAFNLNLGTLIGGLGFRWRLYSKLGLDPGQIGRVFALSLVTNWGGYLLLAGLLLATRSFEPLAQLKLDGELQQLVGIALLVVPTAYVAWCWTAKRRDLRFRGHRFDLPPGRVAVAQLVLSICHWMLAGAAIWTLMPSELPYPAVLGTLLSAAVAGAMVHVPGGLGVIEAVFVATLSDQVPEGALIAALLAYRVAFYLLPLAGAAALHFVLERVAKSSKDRKA